MSDKPAEPVEVMIARDAALKRRLFREKVAAMSEAEKQRLRAVHFMRCPKCGFELEEIVLRDVKIDKCFGCNGIWLDEGELEELTHRTHDDLQVVASLFRTQLPK